jgi:hypothetical protein
VTGFGECLPFGQILIWASFLNELRKYLKYSRYIFTEKYVLNFTKYGSRTIFGDFLSSLGIFLAETTSGHPVPLPHRGRSELAHS